ncbi:hypothetical protein NPIL_660361 [Nephila pilipes]|uniref:HTH CENPB-type domain-containing protein n=1 Tax=Nephila pilipes TaxID=299642 RepID=A0A8X6PGM1_NEPPI|nr:hypothetical protein NPIL_660361 [Nephila pilipes]
MQDAGKSRVIITQMYKKLKVGQEMGPFYDEGTTFPNGESHPDLSSATNDSSKRASYSRNIVIEKTEKALELWIKDLTKKRITVHKELIQEKAGQYFNQLKDLEPSSSSCLRNVKFSASNG